MSRYVETHSCDLFTSHVEMGGDGVVFLHCNVYKNTPSSLKAVKKELKELLEFYAEFGVLNIFSYTRNGRYASAVGGELINSFIYDDIEYEVYVHGN